MKRIAFVTTCKARTPHIKLTLPKNLADNAAYENAVFIVLDYSSPDNLLQYLFTEHEADIKSGRLVVYSFLDDAPGPFRMAHAKNMAHRLGILEGADVLVNLDADNYTGIGFAAYINYEFEKHGPDTFLWANMMPANGPRLQRGCCGRIAVSTPAFLKAGGYDERYNDWGPDDKDFNARLRQLGYMRVEIPRQYLDVVLHNDKLRFREYPHLRESKGTVAGEDSIALPMGTGKSAVRNYGNVGMGRVRRHPDAITFDLPSLPTRIFGIGMHKTGTTSLHHALSILGFDSAHWVGAHWAKRIWRNMNNYGWSETLERHYALCDLPIPMLYEKLDASYPGSKFILTLRNEDAWIHSVERHWSAEYNPYRPGWDSDPFTNRMHRALYGQSAFNKEVFLQRYRRHNAEVRQHFAGRPHDLLIIDMEKQAQWKPLCEFLNTDVPTLPYPKAFATDGRGR